MKQKHCTECNNLVSFKVMKFCWNDPYTSDHRGLCCDCFDVSLGADRTVKLNERTPYRLHDFDDYDL